MKTTPENARDAVGFPSDGAIAFSCAKGAARDARYIYAGAPIRQRRRAALLFSPDNSTCCMFSGWEKFPCPLRATREIRIRLVHTTRSVGAVTRAVCKLKRGDVVGVRGPFGTPWPVEDAAGKDVIIVAGGIGLAPLRPVIYQILSDRAKYGKVVLIYGTRTPADILFQNELAKWRSRLDLRAEVTVDRAPAAWRGPVGVVTTLIPKVSFDPQRSVAMVCGPEVMMRYRGARVGRPRGGKRTRLHLDGAEHEMRGRLLRPLPVGSGIHLQGRPSFSVRSNCAAAGDTRALT